MTKNKGRFRSKTVLALLPVALYYVAKFTGVEIPESDVIQLLETGTTFVLVAMWIYGRFKANTKIK